TGDAAEFRLRHSRARVLGDRQHGHPADSLGRRRSAAPLRGPHRGAEHQRRRGGDARRPAAGGDRISDPQDQSARQPRLSLLLPRRGGAAVRTPRAPRLDTRRTSELAAELRERARSWIPSWALADGERDFGRALLEIAARFSSEVAERLDDAGEKMRRGFLDWLAVRGEAARPARMPVVFKLV